MKNIVLVGMMGAGKTIVGKSISKKLKRDFIDTDELIIDFEERSIKDIFNKDGEEYFRKIENNIIAKVSTLSNKVISLGGGAMQNPDNIYNLKHNGILYYLKVDISELEKRLKYSTDRPLLNLKELRRTIVELMAQREKNYLQADKIILNNSSNNIEEVAKEIIAYYEQCN